MYPSQPTPHTLEGELAHRVVAAVVLDKPLPEDATDEMIEGAYLVKDSIPDHVTVHVEKRVDCSVIHPQCAGTPDVWFYDEVNNTLRVFDYKFGHKFVSEFENWQLIEYALGILDTHKNIPADAQVWLTIVQPRCFTQVTAVRSWGIAAHDLIETYLPQAQAFEDKAMALSPKCITGSECIGCPARHGCGTYQEACMGVIHLAHEMTPHVLSNKAIGTEYALLLEAIDLLKGRASGLEQDMLARIKKGTPVPNWQIKQSEGHRRWLASPQEIIAMGEVLGVNLSDPHAVSPARAEKAGLSKDLVADLTYRPKGDFKLVRETDLKQAFKN